MAAVDTFHEAAEDYLKLDAHSEAYTFPDFVACAKFNVEWRVKSKMQCDLKLQMHCYDERVSYTIEDID